MTTRINPKLINPISASEGSVAAYSAGNVVLSALKIDGVTSPPTNGQSLVWNNSLQKWNPGLPGVQSGLFSSSISNVTPYSVTTSMANAIVFPSTPGYSYIADSILITNTDTNGYSNVAISANILFASSAKEIVHTNLIPIAYRGALELLKKPQVFNAGDVLRLQNANASSMYATITYEAIASNLYFSAANLITSFANTTIYTANNIPAVIESIRCVNTAQNSNAAVTVKWIDSTGAIKTFFVFELILPSNSVIEICENVKRLNANDSISVYASNPNNISVFVSGKTLG
jgi:hypothetical protein